MTVPTRTEQPRNRKVRPRLSASLLIADLSGPEPRFLFGKRHERHRFMPGTYVFPGGRIDKCDHHDDFSTLDWNDDAKLVEKAFGSRRKRLALHAPAICALREAYEETGILIGSAANSQSTMAGFSEHGLHPALSALRLLARATTRRLPTRSVTKPISSSPIGTASALRGMTSDRTASYPDWSGQLRTKPGI